jgi:hypothetical protein
MKILIACEFSGIVRNEFKRKGHDAWSCDLLPSELPGPHIVGDVREVLEEGWDLMIAHPPCTYLCNSGVRWLDKEREEKMEEATELFRTLWFSSIKKVAIENPIPHKYAREKIGDYTQLIQPWQFGHKEKKGTCLWLRGLPELQPTNIKRERSNGIHMMPDKAERWKDRSRTFVGIAKAMADQWG